MSIPVEERKAREHTLADLEAEANAKRDAIHSGKGDPDFGIPRTNKRPRPALPSEQPKRARPIGITSATDGDWTFLYVLFDDGSIWKRDPMGPWTRLPPIPQGDA